MVKDADSCDLPCLGLPKAERLRAALPGADERAERAAAAKAVGDPTRLALALVLGAGESACVCDLAWIVGRDERLVSHHVRLLKGAGLARSERDGKSPSRPPWSRLYVARRITPGPRAGPRRTP